MNKIVAKVMEKNGKKFIDSQFILKIILEFYHIQKIQHCLEIEKDSAWSSIYKISKLGKFEISKKWEFMKIFKNEQIQAI